MSDNIPLYTQRTCMQGDCYNKRLNAEEPHNSDCYVVDLFSYVQPPVYGNSGSPNQVIIYVSRASENSCRLAFMQEEQIRQGMIKVYSNSFYWQKERGTKLMAKLIMEDFKAKKVVDRTKIDEMKMPENIVFTLPSCNASFMKFVAKFMNEDKEVLMETGELNAKLSMLQGETKAGVEHEYCTSEPTEQEIFT